MNRLPVSECVAILRGLTEGCSLRSISRMVGVSINTVTKMLVDAGRACARYQHETMRNLSCQRLQLDEIWNFVYAKQANIPEGMEDVPGIGSMWTWIALDADTKLVPSFLVGLRDGEHAQVFVEDLAGRLANRVQITTDGLRAYVEAIDLAFARQVDYAILHKVYGAPRVDEARYNIAPSLHVPIVGLKPDNTTRALTTALTWGLLPSWANIAKDRRYPNARAETVHILSSFSDPFARKRCIMVGSGFYEWKAVTTKDKRPHLIRMKTHQPFGMAAL